jgi:high-affinity nickel-transport protein
MAEIWQFIVVSIPVMVFLGLRHAMDIDHITAIDNLVRLHGAKKRSRWVGTGFSIGHTVSVVLEMVLIIYIVASVKQVNSISLWGGLAGALALGLIGSINLYSLKRWKKTGSTILATKLLAKSSTLGMGPIRSSLIAGSVFGLGFDTATQISAIALSAVTSAAFGVQAALILAGFFALGMIPADTLDSILLRSALKRIFKTASYAHLSYALSCSALAVAGLESYASVTGSQVIPEWAGIALAGIVIAASLIYSRIAGRKQSEIKHEHRHVHRDGLSHVHPHNHLPSDEDYHEHEHQYESDIDLEKEGEKPDR